LLREAGQYARNGSKALELFIKYVIIIMFTLILAANVKAVAEIQLSGL
jgi:hypothetical protein